MGTHRLRLQYPSKFAAWVQRSGYRDELEFWDSLSTLQRGTVVDHMINYLTSLGYPGTPNDQLKRFLIDQVGKNGTLFDLANEFFDGTFSIGTFTTEAGDILTTENGINLTTE